LQTACTDAMHWPAHIKLAVNISPLQLRNSNLLDIIFCALSETGLAPERLELEIAETALFETETSQWPVLRQLKNLGVSISLDDFGVGYSSLKHLTTFPFDRIKIDQVFTQHLAQRADFAAIVSSVLALGVGLGLSTVAEGVETQQQFEILKASGVNYVQGYLFGRPCHVAELDFERKYSVGSLKNVA
jgi:EAL domain-containing protein (putative c-di-GMP-specific phosphodiesterase class I)